MWAVAGGEGVGGCRRSGWGWLQEVRVGVVAGGNHDFNLQPVY